MDTIKDFLQNLKDRLSSPFISSFVISWLIINWKITYGLLTYNLSELSKSNYSSYEDLVISNSKNINNIVWFPLAGAFFYVLIMPIINGLFKIFHAWITSTTDTKILDITKEGTMPVKRYLKMKEVYEVQKLALKKIESEELSYNLEKDKLHEDLRNYSQQNSKLTTEYTRTNNEFEQLKKINSENTFFEESIKHLPRNWMIKYKNTSFEIPNLKSNPDLSESLLTIINESEIIFRDFPFEKDSKLYSTLNSFNCVIEYYNLNVFQKKMSLLLSFSPNEKQGFTTYISLNFRDFTPISGSDNGFLIIDKVVYAIQLEMSGK